MIKLERKWSMFLSEEIKEEVLRLQNNGEKDIQDKIIDFCVSKFFAMMGNYRDDVRTQQTLRCVNESYKEACKTVIILHENELS